MLCILAVFIPSFFMQGAARALFVPLSLAVGFAMIASYLLSSTFVPVLSVWLLKHTSRHVETPTHATSLFDRLRGRYERLARAASSRCGGCSFPRYLVGERRIDLVRSAAAWAARSFPVVDAGQFRLRLRAPDGTHIARSERDAHSTRST